MDIPTAAILEAIKRAVLWLYENYGQEISAVVLKQLKSVWAKMFSKKNFLILGNRQSGKTSLILLMTDGHPYKLIKGQKETPNPTAASMVIDKPFTPDKGAWLKIKQDVPGDLALRETWKQAITDVKPEGIIYMIDGRLEGKQLQRTIKEADEWVFEQYKSDLRELKALHVFINFSDLWATNPSARMHKEREIRKAFDAALDGRESLKHLSSFEIHSVHLCPNAKEWKDAEKALKHFSVALE
jgi:hypothetical protein